jgi:hypothetical protein
VTEKDLRGLHSARSELLGVRQKEDNAMKAIVQQKYGSPENVL